MKTSFLELLPVLATAVSIASASPLEDLGSPDPGVRDRAATEQRATFQSTPESKWLAVIGGIHAGQTKKEILELLRPFKVTPEGPSASSGPPAENYRLDDEWMLRCTFQNDRNVLLDRFLFPSMRKVEVAHPKNFTGTWVLYFVNGNKSSETSLKDGRPLGEQITYQSNGTKAYVWHYTDKGPDGDHTGYYPSGKVYYHGQYKAGMQVGIWTYYDENGQVTSTREFDKKP